MNYAGIPAAITGKNTGDGTGDDGCIGVQKGQR